MGDASVVVSHEPAVLAASLVEAELKRVGPGARLGVSGGSSMATLRVLREQLPKALWASLRLTWVDERLVPSSSPDSNRGEAFRQGVLSMEQPVQTLLALVCDDESAEDAVRRSTSFFNRDFGGALDVALLGMGEDGHVASLFPGHWALSSKAPIVAIDDSPKPPPNRLTMTFSVLAAPTVARIVVASGQSKKSALTRLVAGDRQLPSVQLGALSVVTDQQLTMRDKS